MWIWSIALLLAIATVAAAFPDGYCNNGASEKVRFITGGGLVISACNSLGLFSQNDCLREDLSRPNLLVAHTCQNQCDTVCPYEPSDCQDSTITFTLMEGSTLGYCGLVTESDCDLAVDDGTFVWHHCPVTCREITQCPPPNPRNPGFCCNHPLQRIELEGGGSVRCYEAEDCFALQSDGRPVWTDCHLQCQERANCDWKQDCQADPVIQMWGQLPLPCSEYLIIWQENGLAIPCEESLEGGGFYYQYCQAQCPQMTGCPTLAPVTQFPSQSPSASPSLGPSKTPTSVPSSLPVGTPSQRPSKTTPSVQPSEAHSTVPSNTLLKLSSSLPSQRPSLLPSKAPNSKAPSSTTSMAPMSGNDPTGASSQDPLSMQSSLQPSSSPLDAPSLDPLSMQPSLSPLASLDPQSMQPSSSPFDSPSGDPLSMHPSSSPFGSPSQDLLSMQSSLQPSSSPLDTLSLSPSIVPVSSASTIPTSISVSDMPSESPSKSPSSSHQAATVPSSDSPWTLGPIQLATNRPTTTESSMPSIEASKIPSLMLSSAPSLILSSLPSSEATDLPLEPSNDPVRDILISESPRLRSTQPSSDTLSDANPSAAPISAVPMTFLPSSVAASRQPSPSPIGLPIEEDSSNGIETPVAYPTVSPTMLPMEAPIQRSPEASTSIPSSAMNSTSVPAVDTSQPTIIKNQSIATTHPTSSQRTLSPIGTPTREPLGIEESTANPTRNENLTRKTSAPAFLRITQAPSTASPRTLSPISSPTHSPSQSPNTGATSVNPDTKKSPELEKSYDTVSDLSASGFEIVNTTVIRVWRFENVDGLSLSAIRSLLPIMEEYFKNYYQEEEVVDRNLQEARRRRARMLECSMQYITQTTIRNETTFSTDLMYNHQLIYESRDQSEIDYDQESSSLRSSILEQQYSAEQVADAPFEDPDRLPELESQLQSSIPGCENVRIREPPNQAWILFKSSIANPIFEPSSVWTARYIYMTLVVTGLLLLFLVYTFKAALFYIEVEIESGEKRVQELQPLTLDEAPQYQPGQWPKLRRNNAISTFIND